MKHSLYPVVAVLVLQACSTSEPFYTPDGASRIPVNSPDAMRRYPVYVEDSKRLSARQNGEANAMAVPVEPRDAAIGEKDGGIAKDQARGRADVAAFNVVAPKAGSAAKLKDAENRMPGRSQQNP